MPPFLYWPAENPRYGRQGREIPSPLRPSLAAIPAALHPKRPAGALLLCGVLTLADAPPTGATSSDCAPAPTEWTTVGKVFDGDTLLTTDGRKVRLVGVNAPERARDGRAEEPFAEDALRFLSKLIPPGTRIGLAFDETPTDRYGRTLAFVWSSASLDVQVALLEQGLAAALVVPPRQNAIACYHRAEETARARGLGLWMSPRYRGTDAAKLPPSARGFHVIRGTIIRLGRSRHAVWLNLTRNFALRVPRKDLPFFPKGWSANRWKGRYIEARGWIYERKGQQRMTIRHPSALRHLTPDQ